MGKPGILRALGVRVLGSNPSSPILLIKNKIINKTKCQKRKKSKQQEDMEQDTDAESELK